MHGVIEPEQDLVKLTSDDVQQNCAKCTKPLPFLALRQCLPTMNPFRYLPYPAQRLKPVKKMLLQKLMDLIIVVELFTTLLKMPDPVKTCVLDLRRKPFIHSTALHISHEHNWSAQATDILLKRSI